MAGRDARLQLIIDALNQSRDELQQLRKDLGDVSEATERGKPRMDGLTKAVTGLFTVAAAGKLAKMVYELGELGAEAQRVETTFVNVAGGAAQAVYMLEQLKVATNNTRSEQELMAGASNILALGLAKDAGELGQVVRNVEALGSRFGGTMQIFQLMMSNKSLMRIDAFGLGVEETTRRIDELKAAGMAADEAFDTAVLELMDKKYQELGGTMDDNLSTIQQNKAAFQDLKTEVGMAYASFTAFASGILPLKGGLKDLLSLTNDVRMEYGYLRGTWAGFWEAVDVFDILPTLIDKQEEHNQQLRAQGAETARLTGLAEYYAKIQGTQIKATEAAADGTFDLFWRMRDVKTETLGLTDVTYDSAAAWRDYSAAVNGSTDHLGDLRQAQEDAALAARRNEDAVTFLNDVMRSTFGEDLREGSANLEELRAKQADVRAEIDRLTASHGRAVTVQRESALSENELALATAQLAEANRKMSEADPGSEAYYKAAVQAEKLQEKIGGAAEATTTFINNSKQIGELEGEYASLQDEIDGLATAMQRTAAQTVAGFVNNLINVDGVISDQEAAMYTHYLYGAGLIDETTRDMMMGAKTLVDSVNEETRTGVEAAAGLLMATQDVVDEFVNAGEVGTTKFGEILTAAGFTADEIRAIQQAAIDAQTAIDAMHGKELEITITQRLKIAGEAYRPEVYDQLWKGEYAEGGMLPMGGYGISGEDGAELLHSTPSGVEITPLGGDAPPSRAFGSAPGLAAPPVNITINGVTDPVEVMHAVQQALRPYLPAVTLR